jgi:hypothetical protein
MCQIVEYTTGSDFTLQDIDLLPWNFEETEVAEEAMQSPKQFTAVRIVEEDGVRDHVNLCAASKEEDDINLYSQAYQRTKNEFERREKLEVGSLNDSLMDLSRYHSPTRNAKKLYDPATIGKLNSQGIFNFEAEEDLVELSANIVDKKSGHATSRNFISSDAANHFRRPFGRHHSFMTEKDIEHEKITDNDFRTNPIISPTKFHRSSVGSTSRPGIPSLSVFDNDNRNTNSDQAKVDEEDYGYSISHSSRCSVSKDKDNDCASFYDLDEGDEDSAKGDQEPASSDEIVAVRVPEEDIYLYSQEYQRTKKEFERREKLEVGTLNDSLMDLSRYHSPTRNAKKFYDPATIGKLNSPGIFNFEAEEDLVDTGNKMREKKVHTNSLRPGMMRGTAFHNDDNDEEAVSKPVHNTRPGMMRGRSYVEDGPRSERSTLISSPRPGLRRVTASDNDGNDDDDEEAVSKPEHNMRPSMIRGRSYVEDGSRPERSTLIPEDFTPEEKAVEEKIVEVMTAANKEWQEYAEEVVKGVQNNDGSEERSEGDEEPDFWIPEAERLEAEAERTKAKEKSEKKKLRKEEERQQKRLETEHGNSVLLKKETRKKKESERKAKSSKTKASNRGSNDTENVGKVESGVDEEKRKRRKEERRQKREATKSKDKSGEDMKELVVGSSEDARRRQLAFSWYSQMSAPDRSEFKRKVAALHSLNITPDDVDLLPWNATGSEVDIAKLNTLSKVSLMR